MNISMFKKLLLLGTCFGAQNICASAMVFRINSTPTGENEITVQAIKGKISGSKKSLFEKIAGNKSVSYTADTGKLTDDLNQLVTISNLPEENKNNIKKKLAILSDPNTTDDQKRRAFNHIRLYIHPDKALLDNNENVDTAATQEERTKLFKTIGNDNVLDMYQNSEISPYKTITECDNLFDSTKTIGFNFDGTEFFAYLNIPVLAPTAHIVLKKLPDFNPLIRDSIKKQPFNIPDVLLAILGSLNLRPQVHYSPETGFKPSLVLFGHVAANRNGLNQENTVNGNLSASAFIKYDLKDRIYTPINLNIRGSLERKEGNITSSAYVNSKLLIMYPEHPAMATEFYPEISGKLKSQVTLPNDIEYEAGIKGSINLDTYDTEIHLNKKITKSGIATLELKTPLLHETPSTLIGSISTPACELSVESALISYKRAAAFKDEGTLQYLNFYKQLSELSPEELSSNQELLEAYNALMQQFENKTEEQILEEQKLTPEEYLAILAANSKIRGSGQTIIPNIFAGASSQSTNEPTTPSTASQGQLTNGSPRQ